MEPVGKRRREGQFLAGGRVNERETCSVQEEPARTPVELGRPAATRSEQTLFPVRAIDGVTDDRMTDRAKVDTNLVGAAGVEANGKQIRGPPPDKSSLLPSNPIHRSRNGPLQSKRLPSRLRNGPSASRASASGPRRTH